MPKRSTQISSKNTLKNKVIINIGSNRSRRNNSSKKPQPKKEESKKQMFSAPPQIIYNTVNPSIDPFAMRQQLATQSLQYQNQLKVNEDLIKSLRSEMSSLRDARFEPSQREIKISPELVEQARVNPTYVDLSKQPYSNEEKYFEREAQTEQREMTERGAQTDAIKETLRYEDYNTREILSSLNFKEGAEPTIKGIARYYGLTIGNSNKSELIEKIMNFLGKQSSSSSSSSSSSFI